MNRKVKAARLSVGSNAVLVGLKLTVGLAIGSVSVISEAIHSAMDLVAAIIAMISVRVASRPADQDHRYGHGKVENLSALVEGALVLVAAVWILYESITALRTGSHAKVFSAGLWVMGLSAGMNALVSSYLFRVAREEESQALEADAIHLRADVWTSLAVFVGLVVVRITGLAWLDPVVAIAVAVLILKSGWDLCRQAMVPLIDSRLPDEEEQEIVRIIEQHSGDFVEFHNLRTRRAGAERHVDFHLVVHGRRSLEEVHRLCDAIEEAIAHRFPRAQVLIHPEPCEEDCDLCWGRRERQHGGVGTPAKRFRSKGTVVRLSREV